MMFLLCRQCLRYAAGFIILLAMANGAILSRQDVDGARRLRATIKFACFFADVKYMLINCPPKSNAQRQREFRERNPGYYQRLHAKRRADVDARLLATQAAAPQASRAPLLLPAPVETIEIPGMTIPAIGQREAIALETTRK